jgi:hypothetical protein
MPNTVRVMVFNGTFNNISVISWRSVLLVEEIVVPQENHRPVSNHLPSGSDNLTGLVMHEVKEIETWILRLLSAPVPVPGKTRVEASNILSATSTFF